MKLAGPLDLERNELRDAVTENLSSAPTSPVAGLRYFDTTIKVERYWDGTQWVNASGGGGAVDSVDGRTGAVTLSDLYVDTTGDNMTGNLGLGYPNPTAKLHLAADTTPAGGIQFGDDANLYRDAPGSAMTDGRLRATGIRSASLQTTATLGTDRVNNGAFTTNLTGWTVGANWAWSAGTALHTTGSTATLSQSVTGLVAGAAYVMTITITGRTTGSVSAYLGTAGQANITGTQQLTVVPSAATATLQITPTTDFNGALDSVSVQPLDPSKPQVCLDGAPGTAVAEMRATGTNLGIGLNALSAPSTAYANTALGSTALRRVATGYGNTAVGSAAAASLVTGINNVAIGDKALTAATSSSSCIAIGVEALAALTITSSNVAIGSAALRAATAGSGGVAIGSNALQTTTNAMASIAIGNAALASTTSTQNVAIGDYVLYMQSTGSNTAYGYRAGYSPAGVAANATTTGTRQTLIGHETGGGSTAQVDDIVCLGYRAVAAGTNAISIGSGVSAAAAGAVAIGRDSTGVSATTATPNNFMLGTATHNVKIPGTLAVTGTIDGLAGFRHGDATKPVWTSGAGNPEGTITAPVGSLYSRTDGGADTAIYRKEGTGATGWVATASAAPGGVTSVDGRTGAVTLADLYVDIAGDTMTGNLGLGQASPTAKLQFATSSLPAGGILFGTDTNLYRSAANTLTTDDTFTSGALVQAALSTTAGGFRQGAAGPLWLAGAGTPEGIVSAPIGSMYSRTDGTTNTAFYRKEIGVGNVGWVAVSSAIGAHATTHYAGGTDPITGKLALGAAQSNTGVILGASAAPTDAFYVTAVGVEALKDLSSTSANSNTAVGYRSLLNLTTGTFNVGVGTLNGQNLSTGDSNTLIGHGIVSAADCNNTVAIGYATRAIVSDTIAIGASVQASHAGGVGIGGNTTAVNDFVLGAATHLVRIPGSLGIGVIPTAKLHLVASTVAAGGILFGSDTNLYRSAANQLSTDDAFTALNYRQGLTGPTWTSGTGSPEGVISAPVGSMYSRTDGGTGTATWRKESGTGNTGWVADTTGGGTGAVASVDGRTGVVSLSDLYVDIAGDTMTGQLNAPSIALGTNPATTGSLRLQNNTSIRWRNAANNADYVVLQVDSSNNTLLNGWGFGVYFAVGGNQKAILQTNNFTLSSGVVMESPSGFRLGTSSAPSWTSGAGSPEGVVTAPVGSMYSRTDGGADTALYRKESGVGATGWVAVADVYVNTAAPPTTPNAGDLWYDTDDVSGLTFPLPISQGGTGAVSQEQARTSLVVPSLVNTAVAAGPPLAGTFVRGDFWIDSANVLWVCTVAGTPGTWVFLGVNKRATRRTPNTTIFTNQTTYATFPSGPERTALQIAFTKRMASSRIIFSLMAHFYVSAGAAQCFYGGITNGTTTWDVAQRWTQTAAVVYHDLVSQVELYGVPAGAHTFEPVFKSATTATFQFDNNWEIAYSVEEVP